MEPVFRQNEGETRYEIFVDQDDLSRIFNRDGSSFDLGDKEANEEYTSKFENEELCSFGVVKMQVCKCCCMWSEVESLWGIHAESAQEAFQVFKEENKQTA